jgi:lipopolysaccharide export system permease protein
VYKLAADRIVWDSTLSKWRLEQVTVRTIDGMKETLTSRGRIDTTYAFYPDEFKRRESNIESLNTPQLAEFIRQERARGVENTAYMDVERHRRTSFPFATFILTVIGVSLSSRRVKGGLGMQLGLGIFIAFSYIMFMQVSTTFAIKAQFSPLVSVWIPNLVFAGVALWLFRRAER